MFSTFFGGHDPSWAPKGTNGQYKNVHAIFILTASIWLFLTAFLGLALVYNFTFPYLPKETLQYLPLHAHAGVVGWFLLLVMGVGSRLIPMFLISKYSNKYLLWVIYVLVNGGLLSFLGLFLYFPGSTYHLFPVLTVLIAFVLFGHYCLRSYNLRIRRQVDEQMKISIL